jgi:molybdopterin molybdotransferase
MENTYSRKTADREAIIPVAITQDGLVSPVEYHGSAHISAFSTATGIIVVPEGKKSIGIGEIVSVRQV